ncbi:MULTISPECIES: AmpG family muropeptide MFS transporter [unclassified Polaromonas]|jgi:PAT family beta-lactamase induction signal transducer AmpG|uniref:AmpG family muropeptide MFS transporter n=1 Tax=unclassified Polaromonas TaxID=2638319 RepID=UPI000BD5AFAB|nr:MULTISPECIES: AmpG family muropeptide MFS transporter [unclassified Polaromonas]OYY38430.1 MAG: AmpG family muropeptide MFS transporter [Polaromonas sp. 35-63-35]OYZ17432.1 MAG: AmpG family muropeptide MFS transporter [Polaromonas sp. 16-63-31]OYZ79168.1 MAG: AmpG family muropeptide MFS transporter [Polaromonas sp. 24-63-21]OZA50169.1 MAG: AmpG family muropeptide MFS transporter [Polaromonas sp. 17-63-33]OZA89337.1 MAG: AmpG family muropeptide MFS transporter [Polaromonas sp. 39-63-25]
MSETLSDDPQAKRQPTPLSEAQLSPISPAPAARPSWAETLRVYLEAPTLRMLLLGFSAGLPLLLVFGTLSFWLREAGIDRTTIGYLSWVGLAYGFKWVWAPLVDRLPIPLLTRLLGRRRSWLLLSQSVIMAALVGMALTDPKIALLPVVWCALAVAFGSATQDIALDAFRIESADVQRQAALAAAYQTGYRMAMIWAGAGVLWIAARAEVAGAGGATGYQHGAWQIAYFAMAASMLLGVVTVLFSPEPAPRELPPARNAAEWIKSALVEPFADFLRRYGKQAALILMLIAVYRISDVVMGIMANPFYVDMGYTKDEVAAVTKIYGVIMTLVGAFVGGALAMRFGVMRVLMLGAVLSAGSNLLFAWLGSLGHDVNALIFVISADNLSSGIASAAFIAYLSSLTNINYSATQYALFSSMMLLLPKFLAGYSGTYVDAFGYSSFFTVTALLGAPVLLLVWLASRMKMPANP